jgi:selenocysteine-specific elongation factor
VLDVEPRKPASKASPDADPTRVVRERTVVRLDEYERLTGLEWDGPVIGAHWAITVDELDQRKARLRKAVVDSGSRGLDFAALTDVDRAVLDELVSDGADAGEDSVQLDGGHAVLRSAPDPLANHPFVLALDAAMFAPPDAAGVDRGELRELIRKGRVVESDGVYFSPLAIDAATTIVRGLLDATTNEGVTVAEVRDAVGASRKHVLPLLAHLDATGRTRRRGDFRIAGPRMLRETGDRQT